MDPHEGITVDNQFFQNPLIKYEEEILNFKEIPTNGGKVVEFFNGKRIFLTGGTGLLGKLLTEKLLRLCPNTKIFVLCRPKKINVKERLEQLYNHEFFARLEKVDSKFRSRIIPICGNLDSLGLGLSKEDRETLTSKVDIIIHAGATLKFNDPLKVCATTNLRGTKQVIDLAKRCKNLLVFAHVSTAYTHTEIQAPQEVFYNTIDTPPYEVLDLLEANDETKLRELEERISKFANNYTYSKACSEKLIEIECQDMPTVMFRPGIVISTYEDPLPGWINKIYGGVAAIEADARLGILRVLQCDENLNANLIPGDYTINSLLVAIYMHHVDRPLKISIYNYVSTSENPITWRTFQNYDQHYGSQVPLNDLVWYPNLILCKNRIIYIFLAVFLQFIPALIIDTLRLHTGNKTRMVKIQKKLFELNTLLLPFTTTSHQFSNDHVQELWAKTSEIDRKIFPFDIKNIDWMKHSQRIIVGLKKYVLKDPLDTMQEAKLKFRRFYIIHKILYYFMIFFGLSILYGILVVILGF